MLSTFITFAACTRFAMAIVLGLNQPAPSSATDDASPKYQRFPYYWPHCEADFVITSQEECSEAIAALGITNGGSSWTGSRTTMPGGCSLQKDTNSMIFNTNSDASQRRWDLAPVCKWTGEEAPPDFFRVSREEVTEWRGVEHTITVKPEEWDYFLAFQESRKNGFSCPCNGEDFCNEIEGPGLHWHPGNPDPLTFDCTLWIATWMHAEDQSIQGYCSHNSRDGFSPRMRCEEVGAVYMGEHAACQGARHTEGPKALRGLQTSPGHCNSMFNPSYGGFAVAHGANITSGGGNVWVALYNSGGSDITDSESCIPEGFTATGERTSTDSKPPTPGPSTEPEPPTPGPSMEPKPPTLDPSSDYQKLGFGEDACPEGLEIESESECSEAIAALGVTNGGPSWTGSRTSMPRGCSLQRDTDSRVFNTGEGGTGRHDLAPVCKSSSNALIESRPEDPSINDPSTGRALRSSPDYSSAAQSLSPSTSVFLMVLTSFFLKNA